MKKQTTITIINDCHDGNAQARQLIRYQSLLGGTTPVFIPVNSELEAMGNLVDAIDAYKDYEGLIVVNVAPRGSKKEYKNGIPFCFHEVGKLIIIGTPNCFSLAKKLGIFSRTYQVDVLQTCQLFLPKREAVRISKSQFRSYEFLPLLALWLTQKKQIPRIEYVIPDFGNEQYIWYIDNFGNCKTTATQEGQFSQPIFENVRFFEHLSDVPRGGKPAITVGSSGYGHQRFCEIVIQNQSTAKILNLSAGDVV